MNETGRQLRLLICLDGMREDQGATRVVLGSQHWREEEATAWCRERHPLDAEGVAACCPPGGVVVLGPTVVHGAGINLSGLTRRNLVVQWGVRQDITCREIEESCFGQHVG